MLERGEWDVSCDQLFWAGNVGSGSHDRPQNPKSSVSADAFPICPREQTYLPISELLPPPALGERRHRGLALENCAFPKNPKVLKLRAVLVFGVCDRLFGFSLPDAVFANV